MRKIFSLFLGFLLVFQQLFIFTPQARAQTSYVWPGATWETATPEEMGMDSATLDQAVAYAGGNGYITRSGKLVKSWGDTTKKTSLKSTTKSIGVTAVGLAIDDGLFTINDLADPLHPSLGVPPDSNLDTGWLPFISLKHLTTHTAGFDKNGGYENLLFEPGTEWSYSDGGANWLAEVTTLAFGQDLNDVLFNRVFTPIGISTTDLSWRANAYRSDTINGIKNREFGSGISASVDAMARIGYLYLRNGEWNGQQLLSQSFIDQARVPAPEIVGLPVRNPNNYFNSSDHYGLLWWNNGDGTLPNTPTDAYWSWGLNDSVMLVIPSLDVVASRTGTGWRTGWTPDYSVIELFIQPIVDSILGEPDPTPTPTPTPSPTPTPTPTPNPNGLAGYWNLDEGFGSTVGDQSENANSGSLVGNVNWVAGQANTGLEFPGLKGNYVSVPDVNNSLDFIGDFTVSAWVNFDDLVTTKPARMPRLVQKGNQTSNLNYYLAIDTLNGDKPSFRVRISGTNYTLSSDDSIVPGEWYHITGVREGGSARVYINGVKTGETNGWPVTDAYTNDMDFVIGGSIGNSDGMTDGVIDEVKVFDYALSDTEVLSEYNPPVPGPGNIHFVSANYTVDEGAGSVLVEVERVNDTFGDISVDYATSQNTATQDVDYASRSGTLAWADGEGGIKSFSVDIIDDAEFDPDESFSVVLSSSTPSGLIDEPSETDIAIIDNEVNAAPVVAAGDDQIFALPQNTTTLTGTANDDGFPDGTLTTLWEQMSGPAATITTPSATTTDVTLTDEGDYVFRLTADDSLLQSSDELTVSLSLEPQPGVVRFEFASYSVDESGVSVDVSALRESGSSGAVSVDYITSDVEALAGADYASTSGTLNWADGDTTPKTATVAIFNDSDYDPDETFAINLQNPIGGLTIGLPSSATIAITDDEINAAPTVNAGTDDSVTLPTNTYTLSGSVSDDGFPNGTLTTLWEQISGPAATITTPSATTTDVTLTDAGDYVFRLTADDSLLQASDEVAITLNPEPNPGTVRVEFASYNPVENGVSVDINILRELGSSGAVSVDFLTTDGTAVAGDDYASASGVLNWADGDLAPKTVTVSILDDALYDPDETFDFTVQNPTGGALLGTPDAAAVTIADNEVNTAPVVDAGADDSIALPTNTYTLSGSASDDGFPNGTLTTLWEQVSGPAATIATPSATTTDVTFPDVGTYVFRLSADDGLLTGSDEVSIVVNPEPGEIPADWWDANWTSRTRINIDNTAANSDLTNFPILVKLDSTNFDYTKALADGDDIRFIDSLGNPLEFELDYWDTNGESNIWVNVPLISATGADYIYMYYQNFAALPASSSAAWDIPYVGVWHMNSIDAAELTADATENANNATFINTALPLTAGILGNTSNLDGVDDYLWVDNSVSLDTNPQLTYSAWIYPTATGDREIISKKKSDREFRLAGASDTTMYLRGCIQTSSSTCSDSAAGTIALNSWQHVTMTYDDLGDRMVHLYINGQEVAYADQAVGSGAFTSDDGADMNIGRRTNNSRRFAGNIDEVRVGDSAREADWIKAEYDSMANAFLAFDPEESI